METTTIKRNGVYIIFPVRVEEPLKEQRIPERKKNIQPVITMPKKRKSNPKLHVAKHIERKKCMHCSESVWRSDVSYCWDCYKYEHFESK